MFFMSFSRSTSNQRPKFRHINIVWVRKMINGSDLDLGVYEFQKKWM